MKIIYSLIMLFSFVVGTLQPIMPAIDYQLNQGSIFELLNSECELEQPTKAISLIDKDCPSGENENGQNLLDIDYYPLALQLSSIPNPVSIPHKSRIYISLREDTITLNFLPNPPPPRLS